MRHKFTAAALRFFLCICTLLLPLTGCVSSGVIPKGALVRDAKVEVSTPWGTARLEAAEIDSRPLPRPTPPAKAP